MTLVNFIHKISNLPNRIEHALAAITSLIDRKGITEMGFPRRFIKRAAKLDTLKKRIRDHEARWPDFDNMSCALNRRNRLTRKLSRETKFLMSDCTNFLLDPFSNR